MLKHVVFTVLLVFFTCLGFASSWKLKSDLSVSLNQGYYSDNWAGSELGSVSWNSSSNTSLEGEVIPRLQSVNTLKMSFGQTHRQIKSTDLQLSWEKPSKSTDKISFESILKFRTGIIVDPYLSGKWDSQFLDQSDPQQTIIFNPSGFTEAIGIFVPILQQEHQSLNFRLGAAMRQFVNREVYHPETNDFQTDILSDSGLEFISAYERKISEPETKLNSRLSLYQAIVNSESDLPESNWKALDVRWENSITTKIWGALNMSFGVDVKYEKEEDDAIQIKQTMGVSLTYILF